MKRAAIIFTVLSVLLLADGLYLNLSNNTQGCGCNGDNGTLFGGSTSIALSTGTEVLIGAGFLLVVAIVIWIWLGVRGQLGRGTSQAGQAQVASAQAVSANSQPAKSQPAKAQAAKESAGAAPAGAAAASAGAGPAAGAEAKTEVTAGQGQPRKESGDQR
jgi:hypothetical protein